MGCFHFSNLKPKKMQIQKKKRTQNLTELKYHSVLTHRYKIHTIPVVFPCGYHLYEC